jgi:cytochrome b6-f complex iron-sulfur subunit
MEPTGQSISRRSFLNFIWKALLTLSGLLGLGGILQFLGYQTEPAPPTRFNLGNITNYPPGSRVVIPEALAIIQHTAQGLKAYSLVCPHLGCTLEPKQEGFDCPCHGSKFYENGAIRNGPASKSMTEYRLEETPDAMLILHTD